MLGVRRCTMTPATRQWTEKRNLSPRDRETLIYILGRLSRSDTLPSDILVLLTEHPKMWMPRSNETH